MNHRDSNPDETDLLLSRAVAGDARALDEIRARGAGDPALLEELALWQADELRLSRAVGALHAAAERVKTPRQGQSGSEVFRTRRAGLGWAVAAVLAVGWLLSSALPAPNEAPANIAGVGAPAFDSSDAAFDAYLAKAREEGVVVGDVEPPTLVGSRELGDGGGFEIVIVRQVYERRRAPEIYRIAPTDETGRARPIVIRPRTESVQ
ncbi:MAG: hypothetical protein ACKO0W_08395 [Planctomycetota bacterium]